MIMIIVIIIITIIIIIIIIIIVTCIHELLIHATEGSGSHVESKNGQQWWYESAATASAEAASIDIIIRITIKPPNQSPTPQAPTLDPNPQHTWLTGRVRSLWYVQVIPLTCAVTCVAWRVLCDEQRMKCNVQRMPYLEFLRKQHQKRGRVTCAADGRRLHRVWLSVLGSSVVFWGWRWGVLGWRFNFFWFVVQDLGFVL